MPRAKKRPGRGQPTSRAPMRPGPLVTATFRSRADAGHGRASRGGQDGPQVSAAGQLRDNSP